MLSAFSFGKIIKTFLPGTILCAALLLALETAFQWIGHRSIVPIIANKDIIVATTAALLPIALILGFVLNTVVWLLVNRLVARPIVHRRLAKSSTYVCLHAGLLARMHAGLKDCAQDLDSVGDHFDSIEYYYLPLITLERHNLVWESYFSWYEFQANTALAIVIFAVALCAYLSVLRLKPIHESWAEASTIVIAVTGFATLLWASLLNLEEFERKLLILIAGSLAEKEDPQPAQSPRWH